MISPVRATLTGFAVGVRFTVRFATCTVEELSRLSETTTWQAAPLFGQCADALLASWKIWKRATVGGNICLSLPAGAMISLAVALDADAVIWSRGGGERRLPVAEFVTGVGGNLLHDGDILRSIRIEAPKLSSRTAFRKIALSPLGRSGAVVIGRRDAVHPGGWTEVSGYPALRDALFPA